MSRRTAKSRRTSGAARRGMSLIEIVFAMATLAAAAMLVFTAIGFVHARQKREQRRLACAEIANRLMLMRLDEEESLPPPGLAIAYDGALYGWALRDEPVPLAESAAVRRARETRQARHDRLRQLSIDVWLDGGDAVRTSLTRLYDPLAFDRNPESAENMVKNHLDKMTRIILQGGDH